MYYKLGNVLLVMVSCLVCLFAYEAKTQGLVSLSEEAMFDDELESNRNFPIIEGEANPEAEGIVSSSRKDSAVVPNKELIEEKSDNSSEISASKIEIKSVQGNAEKDIDVKENVFAAPVVNTAKTVYNGDKPIDDFGEIKGDLFSQMSDIEKRTALLNLELRREKLQNEIEAVKSQRRQALIAEEEKAEAKRLKNIEFEKEQERKVLAEQEKLRKLDIKFETLRQENILGAYKNKMLEEHQKWIDHNEVFYDQIADLRASKKKLVENIKTKAEELKREAQKANEMYNSKIETYKKQNKDLQAQLEVLRKRIETVERERDELSVNPFAGVDKSSYGNISSITTSDEGGESVDTEPIETNLSKMYAVTEIRGQGGDMVAKLINKNGTTFYVKKGTVLQSGHVIGKITSTYVTAEKNGDENYLYFAAGGILPTETTNFELDSTNESK